MSTFPQNGEIWWIDIPNQPNDPHQPRTAVIVSTNSRNRACNDVIAVPTSSSIVHPHAELHVFLPKGEGGLSVDSYAKCEQITTIDKQLLVRGPLGHPIHLKYRWQIIKAMRIAVGDTRV